MLDSDWFVLQTIAGKEQKSVDLLSKINLTSLNPFLPKKKIKIKKNKITKDVVLPLYPGYVFIVGDWSPVEAKSILLIPGIVKFVGGIKTPGKLLNEEKTLILKLTKDGVINYSKVINDGTKIKVISGPLKDLEGTIESVDRRKQRAVVRLTLLNRLIKVTLGFEFINPEEKK